MSLCLPTEHMRTIFVNATVNPTDHNIVQKRVAKAFMYDSTVDKEHNVMRYTNRHDYINWILQQTSKRLRREISVNLTSDHFIYPVPVSITDVINVESPFWTDLIKRFEPIQDWKIVVSIAALISLQKFKSSPIKVPLKKL